MTNADREGWLPAVASDQLADGSATECVIGDHIVAIFRSEGDLYALDAMCAHQGGPIAKGTVADKCVTCPWHGWQYELATGVQTIHRQKLLNCYPVRECGGQIYVRVN